MRPTDNRPARPLFALGKPAQRPQPAPDPKALPQRDTRVLSDEAHEIFLAPNAD